MQIRAQRPMDPAMPLLSRALLVGLLVSLTAMLPAGAAMPEPQSPFEPTGRWMLELDGEPVAADILYSERDVCFVVRSAALDRPLLLDVRDRSFTEISPSRLEPRPDGLIRLGSADPEDESHRRGTFVEGGSDYRFDFDDRAVRIAPKPHLAGPQSVGDMRGHNPKIALPTRKFRMKSNSTRTLARARLSGACASVFRQLEHHERSCLATPLRAGASPVRHVLQLRLLRPTQAHGSRSHGPRP